MDLFEYQGKQYFARYDIPVSPGGPADTVDEAVKEAASAGYPVVVKAQVHRSTMLAMTGTKQSRTEVLIILNSV